MGDQWGHRNVLVTCSLGIAGASVGHAVSANLGHLVIARIFFGLAVAGTLPAANALIHRMTDQRHIGKAYGLATSLSMAGFALGPLAGGYLAKVMGLRGPFLVTALAQLCVCLLALTALPSRDGRGGRPTS